MEEIVARMLAWQVGGWSYPGGGADLSNTQYGTLFLPQVNWRSSKNQRRVRAAAPAMV